MRISICFACVVLACAIAMTSDARAAHHFGWNSDKVLVIDYTRKVFPIGFTVPPPPTALTPTGKNGIQELHDAGALFMRTGLNTTWDSGGLAIEQSYEDAAAKYGMFCQLWLRDLAESTTSDATLKTVINKFKSHNGLGVWKGSDEPQWGGKPVATLKHVYDIIKANDPDHPVWIVQAPRGTVDQLKAYDPTYDIVGADIYPVSYPQGLHIPSDANKEISAVGDYTDKMAAVAMNKKPVWITLQIAWSGVTPPGKRLRFANFKEERFMAYEAIIHGARGLQFFGGTITSTLNPRDAKLGWNWTYWDSILKPLILEIGDKSALKNALVAPRSSLPIKANNTGIELTVREVGTSDLYVFACKREPTSTVQVTFTDIPSGYTSGEVMYEAPQRVSVSAGAFSDWFAPFDVHVYHFHK